MSTSSDQRLERVTLGHFIGGRAVPGASRRSGPVYNPATGETARHVSSGDGR